MSAGTPPEARESQTERLAERFAAIERWGGRGALYLILAAFALYVSGLLRAHVPPERLTGLIGQGAEAYVSATGLPRGWAWVYQLHHGDLLSLGSLVVLVGVVAAAYVGLIPLLMRFRDRLYLALVIAQLLVFALAASGLLTAWH